MASEDCIFCFPPRGEVRRFQAPVDQNKLDQTGFFFFFVGSKLSMHSVVLFVCLGVVIVEHRTTHPGVSSVSSHG